MVSLYSKHDEWTVLQLTVNRTYHMTNGRVYNYESIYDLCTQVRKIVQSRPSITYGIVEGPYTLSALTPYLGYITKYRGYNSTYIRYNPKYIRYNPKYMGFNPKYMGYNTITEQSIFK
jgi:hypothetical protein